jgi:hypothetical protein
VPPAVWPVAIFTIVPVVMKNGIFDRFSRANSYSTSTGIDTCSAALSAVLWAAVSVPPSVAPPGSSSIGLIRTTAVAFKPASSRAVGAIETVLVLDTDERSGTLTP